MRTNDSWSFYWGLYVGLCVKHNTKTHNNDDPNASSLISFHRNIFSVLNTLLSQTPVCIFYHFLPPFLTFFHTFLFSKHYIPRLSSSGRTSVCPRSHQSQHAWLLPNLGYVFFFLFCFFFYLLSTLWPNSHHFLILQHLSRGCTSRWS